MTEKKEAKESPIISLEVVTALSIMKGDFNMKDLRNPLNRTENFEHPSGNVMKSTAVSTEIPMSADFMAAASLIPSPINPTV